MLVVDVHALQPVHFLDFVHQVLLQFLLAEHMQNVMRVPRPVHQRFADADAFALLRNFTIPLTSAINLIFSKTLNT